MTIYNFGSINIDHVYSVPHLVKAGETLSSTHYKTLLGGKGANQSIALAKAGAKVRHIGRFHQADKSIVEDPFNNAGVDCSLLQTVEHPTGHAIIQVDDGGQNSIILYAGANHSFTEADINNALEPAKAGDWLLLQNECNQLEEAIKKGIKKGLKLVINTAPMNDLILELPLEVFEVIIANEVEASKLFGLPEQEFMAIATLIATSISTNNIDSPQIKQLDKAIKKLCPKSTVVITLGEKGVIGWDGKWCFSPAKSVPVVDTTAAGDTFTGYLLAALSQNKVLINAMAWASQASALCVQKAGASTSIPSLDQVNLEMVKNNEA